MCSEATAATQGPRSHSAGPAQLGPVGCAPAQAHGSDPKSTYHSPNQTPPPQPGSLPTVGSSRPQPNRLLVAKQVAMDTASWARGSALSMCGGETGALGSMGGKGGWGVGYSPPFWRVVLTGGVEEKGQCSISSQKLSFSTAKESVAVGSPPGSRRVLGGRGLTPQS